MKNGAQGLNVIPVPFSGEIQPGDSLIEKLLLATKHPKLQLRAGDILVIKHKIVSKAEGQSVELANVKASADSRSWTRRYNLDERVVELAISESKRIVRRKRGVLITETRHGFICANSGVDASNAGGHARAVLLPKDPDASAARLHRELKKRLRVSVPVIISDSFGRPWREGLTEVAIGVAGMKPLLDYRGARDPHGYSLHATVEAVADELACAAGLVCGKLTRMPACIVRGYCYESGQGSGKELIRSATQDLFR
jgi:coenzyme F420-0:L-glutamate ligase/coenzyme F420-1:gamma-L-glutamate ligase